MPNWKIILGDCIEEMKKLEENSIDSICTDSPYALINASRNGSLRSNNPDNPAGRHGSKGGFMGQCYHPNTEVLTKVGWKKINNISNVDLICSLNPTSNLIEYVKIDKIHKYPYEGDMYHISGRSTEQLVTPNHNVYLRFEKRNNYEFVRADEIPRVYRLKNQGIWIGKNDNTIKIGGEFFESRSFLEFFGLFLGDGYTVSRVAQPWKQDYFGFHVKKNRKIISIRNCLIGLGVKYTENFSKTTGYTTFYIYNKHLLEYLKQFGGAREKYIPNEFLDFDSSLLENLYIGMINTDGNKQRSGQEEYFSSNSRLIDDFQRLCLHTGRSGTIGVRPPRDVVINGNLVTQNGPAYVVSVLKSDKELYLEKIDHKSGKQSVATLNYGGNVYCLELEKNHILLTRLKGKSVWSGNSWDAPGDGTLKGFQEWTEKWAKEALRVTKPGGHLVNFGSSRTYHRMACGIEDAGWDIRDSLQYVYGCLDSKTEILTKNGWKKYTDISKGELVACWDSNTGEVFLDQIRDIYIYKYNGDLISIKNQDVDLLLTPNHRVYNKKRRQKMINKKYIYNIDESWTVIDADNIYKEYRDTFIPLSGWSNGKGIGGEDYAAFLGWIWSEGHFDDKYSKDNPRGGNGVRIYQTSTNSDYVEEIQNLIDKLELKHKRYDYVRTYKGKKFILYTWFFSGEISKIVRNLLIDKKPSWELIWNMTLEEKVAFTDAAWKGDGARRNRGRFYQKDDTKEIYQVLLHLTGKRGWINPKKNVVGCESKTTTQVIKRHKSKVKYNDNVWCVRVSSGAFLIRRNGKISITGNSGFSKGQNIGKTIDKIKRGHPHGTEDPESPNHGKYKGGGGQGAGASTFLQPGQTYQSGEEKKGGYYNYNTTLKPAHEIIVLARKPLETSSIATNVLKWGTGAINIGATRVSLEGENLEIKGRDGRELDTAEMGWGFKRVDGEGDLGRYPPNFLLSHSIDCEIIGYKSVKSNGHHSGRVPDGGGLYNLGLKPQEDLGNIHAEDGLEKIEDWKCSESCPIKLLDEQTGLRKSGGNISGDEPSKPAKNVYGDYKRTSFKSHADIGTASRFFPKFSIEDYDLFYYCPKASRSEREAGCEVLKGGETYREGPMAGRGAPGLKCKNCNKWKNSGNPCKCSATDFEQVQFERKEIFNAHACLSPDSLVVTNKGIVEIKNIKIGDKVLSYNGEFSTVTDCFTNKYDDDIYRISVFGTNLTIDATDNHPILIWRPQRYHNKVKSGIVMFLEASKVKVGDYTMTPIIKSKNIAIDSNFAYMFGLWVAEGCFQKAGHGNNKYPVYSLHKDEIEYIDKIKKFFCEDKVSVYKKDSDGVTVMAFNPKYGEIFEHLAGKGARTKCLNEEIFQWSIESLNAFLDGYLAGDGSKVRNYIESNTSSKALSWQLRIIGEMCGYKVNVYYYAKRFGKTIPKIRGRIIKGGSFYQMYWYKVNTVIGRNRNRKPSRPTTIEVDGLSYILSYVKSIKKIPYCEHVYNISVDNSHTFQTVIGMTHNTVKPLKLMRWLVKLVTPDFKESTILDPFAGSCSTLCAAVLEGFNCIGIEQNSHYVDIGTARVEYWAEQVPKGKQTKLEV